MADIDERGLEAAMNAYHPQTVGQPDRDRLKKAIAAYLSTLPTAPAEADAWIRWDNASLHMDGSRYGQAKNRQIDKYSKPYYDATALAAKGAEIERLRAERGLFRNQLIEEWTAEARKGEDRPSYEMARAYAESRANEMLDAFQDSTRALKEGGENG